MKPLRANTFLADRGDRLGCFKFHSCPPPPPGGQVRTAPVVTPPATGAAVLLTQGSAAEEARSAHNREVAGSTPAPATIFCAGGVGSAAQETAPAAHPAPAGAVTLSEASAIILSLIAAHEGRAPGDILALLIAGAAEAIGIHELIVRDAGDVDPCELPGFARRAANRFRGGGP